MAIPNVVLTWETKLSAVETPGTSPATLNPTASITHNAYDQKGTYSVAAPNPAKCAYFHVVKGAPGIIDLTALPGINGSTVNGTGQSVQFIRFRAVTAAGALNGANVSLTFGAANPYDLMGPAFLFVLEPGQWVTFGGSNQCPAIGAGANRIDITGPGAATDGVEVSVIMG